MILRLKDTHENCMFLPSNMKFSYMRELLFSQLWEKTNILVSTRIAFLRRELLLGKSTKNSLNLLQTRITQRKVILVCIVRESLILVCFIGENYIKPRRELSFSLLENDNSRLNIVILPLIRGENHVIRGTITVSRRWAGLRPSLKECLCSSQLLPEGKFFFLSQSNEQSID